MAKGLQASSYPHPRTPTQDSRLGRCPARDVRNEVAQEPATILEVYAPDLMYRRGGPIEADQEGYPVAAGTQLARYLVGDACSRGEAPDPVRPSWPHGPNLPNV